MGEEREKTKKERWRAGRREIKVAETYKMACVKRKNEVERDCLKTTRVGEMREREKVKEKDRGRGGG